MNAIADEFKLSYFADHANAAGQLAPDDRELRTRWDATLDELLAVFRGLERRGQSIPGFSLMPTLIMMRVLFKIYILFLLDTLFCFVLVPLNTIVFLRNLLARGTRPIWAGKWPYRFFTKSYVKRGLQWIWAGEAVPSYVVVGPLVRSMLRDDIGGGLRLVRREMGFLSARVRDGDGAGLMPRPLRRPLLGRTRRSGYRPRPRGRTTTPLCCSTDDSTRASCRSMALRM